MVDFLEHHTSATFVNKLAAVGGKPQSFEHLGR
jgi:hypothetical protein